jgi:hypothetical protein
MNEESLLDKAKWDQIRLIHASSLWPRDELIRYAREWLREPGREFLNLPSSQTQALWQSVCRATTLEEFQEALEEFFKGNPAKGKRGVEGRGKKNSPWVRGPGEPLTQKLRDGMDAAEKAVIEVRDISNDAYDSALEALGETCPPRAMEIRREFLKTLLRLHCSREDYPFQLEEL